MRSLINAYHVVDNKLPTATDLLITRLYGTSTIVLVTDPEHCHGKHNPLVIVAVFVLVPLVT